MDSFDVILNQATHRFIADITHIWNKIGVTESERDFVVENVLQNMVKCMNASLDAAKQQERMLLQTLDNNVRQLRELELELSVAPYEPDDSLTLLELAEELRSKIEFLVEEKQARHLCEIDVARDMLVELDRPPQTTVEHSVFERDLNVSLADVRQCQLELSRELLSNREEIRTLRSRLNELFDVMRISVEERAEQFALIGAENSAKHSTIEQLNHVIDDYERLKTQRLVELLDDGKQELDELWNICGFTPEQRQQQCPVYFTDEVTESTLHELCTCIEYMRQYHTNTCRIADNITKRQDLWAQLLELQRKSFDPERLSNRGGCLLKDEKERKRLIAEINKLDREISQDIVQFEENSGEIFRFSGQSFEDLCNEQWNEYKQKKTSDKENRHKKKSEELKTEMRFGSKPAPTGRKRGGGFSTFKPVPPTDSNKMKPPVPRYVVPSSAPSGCVVMERDHSGLSSTGMSSASGSSVNSAQ